MFLNVFNFLEKISSRNNKGYSMIVLVIAIIVILILTTVSVTTLQTTREKTNTMHFINDIQAVESEVKSYYTANGTLPVRAGSGDYDYKFGKLDIYALANSINASVQHVNQTVFLSQLSLDDNENYYYIDLGQLNTMSLFDSNRGYFLNEGSLKVYVDQGIETASSKSDNSYTTYFTLTSNLVDGQENYVPQEEEIRVIGIPTVWTKEAKVLVVLPKRDFSGDIVTSSPVGNVVQSPLSGWELKWDFGPKSIEEMRIVTGDKNRFTYGTPLKIKSNGTYTIYAKSDDGQESICNIIINKIDDIRPNYKFAEDASSLTFSDNETGLKATRFKTLKTYKDNVGSAYDETNMDARTKIDFYLMDGEGIDIVNNLQNQIDYYIKTRKEILVAIEEENDSFERWEAELLKPEVAELTTQGEIDARKNSHSIAIEGKEAELETLYKEYPYIYDLDGTSDDSRLVIYIEDVAGNAVIVGDNDFISMRMIVNSFNLNIKGLEE